jgi:hypothetical protein
MIRPPMNENPNKNNSLKASKIIDNALATCMFALRTSVHQMLQTNPANIAFRRDMIFNTKTPCNFQQIQQKY